jgi:peroxiredoxin Q/BCP
MSRFGTFVSVLRTLRAIAASVTAVALGLTRMVTSRNTGERVELEAGDIAPDFTLGASNGRTYRLADLLGHGIVVIAWFPKAFTGG